MMMEGKNVMVYTLGNVVTQPKTRYVYENPEPDAATNRRSQEFYDAFADRLNVVAWACGRYGQRSYSPELGPAFSENLKKRMDASLDINIDFSIQMVGHPILHHKEPYFIVCDFIPYVDLKVLDRVSFPYFTIDYPRTQDFLYQEATGVICYTAVQRYMLINWMRLDPCKVTAVCSGVNGFVEADFQKQKSKLILWVGSDFDNKGGHEVVEAFKLLYADDPAYRLTMVGIERQIDHPGITVIPFLHGKDLEKLDDLYRAAAVFVMPSFKENLGLVYLEAMAHKTPVVTTTRGGIAEIIRRTQAGIAIPPGDPVKIREAVLEILTGGDYEGYCERAYCFARKNACWDVAADRMVDAISRWLEHKPVPDDYTDYAIEEKWLPYPSVIHEGPR